jgi:hypothetical protein
MESFQPIKRLKDKKKIVVESGNRTKREDMLCVDGTWLLSVQRPTEGLPLVIFCTAGRYTHRDDQWRTEGGQHPPLPELPKFLPKLSQVPSSVEYTSV